MVRATLKIEGFEPLIDQEFSVEGESLHQVLARLIEKAEDLGDQFPVPESGAIPKHIGVPMVIHRISDATDTEKIATT